MDWNTLLKEQQSDFCERLKSGNLLVSDINFQFSELVIIKEQNLATIKQNSQQIVTQYQALYPNLNLYKQTLKNYLNQYAINQIFGDLLIKLPAEDIFINHDYLSYALKKISEINILVKFNSDTLDSNNIRWCFFQEEIHNYRILICLYSSNNFDENYDKYSIILAGFLPCKLLNMSNKLIKLSLENLFYSGGIKSYLKYFIDKRFYYLNSAKKSNQIGDYLTAINSYNKALKSNINDYKIYLLRAIAKWKIGDKQGALEDCNEAIRLNNDYDLAYHWRGYINCKLGNYKEALADYTEEITINPSSTYAYYRRGFNNQKIGNLLAAFHDYSQVINLNQNLYQSFYNRSSIRYELGDKYGAIEDLNKALKINPYLPQAYYNRAIIYTDLKKINQAINDYQEAIKIFPNYSKAYYNLAILQADLGEYKKAIENYNKIKEFDPNFLQADYNKESLLNYLKQNMKQPILDYKEKIKINFKKQKQNHYQQPQLERELDLSPEKNHESESLKLYMNKDSQIEKKRIDPWNTKQV